MHAGGLAIENLHAVHSAIAFAGLRIFRKHHGQSYERAAIARPAVQNRIFGEREILAFDDFLARAAGNVFRKRVTDLAQFRNHLQLVQQAFGLLHFQKSGDAQSDFIDIFHSQREFHSPHAGEGINQQRDARTFRFFKQQCRTVALNGTVGEFGDLQIGVRFKRYALEFALLFQSAYKLAQVFKRH